MIAGRNCVSMIPITMTWLWCFFCTIAAVGLMFDVFLINRHDFYCHKVSVGVIVGWFICAIVFGINIHYILGSSSALQFFTGYILEMSLSIDNLFVFMSVFSCFKLKILAQQKALTFGIFGAIILRFIFIFIGISLVNKFHWLMYVFGLMLIISAFGMLKNKQQNNDPKRWMASIKKFFRIRESADGLKFFMKFNNRWYCTPLLVCVIVIECVDIVFAIDSVPAVLAISRNPLIVFSSNVFAIVGLRAIYVLLVRMTEKFHLLKYGVAANLIFVGIKMLIDDIYEIPTQWSILAIVGFLAISVICSLKFRKTS